PSLRLAGRRRQILAHVRPSGENAGNACDGAAARLPRAPAPPSRAGGFRRARIAVRSGSTGRAWSRRMKFAFITPRYGADISAGPEHACRLLAEQVSQRHDVDVLTTCARDPQTWKNEFGEGTDRIRGVLVRRFPVSQGHDGAAFHQLTQRLFISPRS